MLCGQGMVSRPELVHCGIVEGKPIDQIQLDTGAATTLVHRDLVPADKILPHAIDIRCAHGDVTCYPMAEGGGLFLRTGSCALAFTCPCTHWEGCPTLDQAIGDSKGGCQQPSLRASSGRSSDAQPGEAGGAGRLGVSETRGDVAARPSPVEEEEQPFNGLNGILFQGSRNWPHQMRRQKRS